ncbi:hypothetical protein [Loktanella sp. S4079]|uniref:hypothetical protein n=1 Tax=Loktanella sp. S4079 TaxID=579483 RepID=UPI0005F9F1AB|nr:hypothetical protein [Loktanella sp. S4079]KJZ20598.1 hypothetical protein TW80_07445 [Loktanella sp. S4079]
MATYEVRDLLEEWKSVQCTRPNKTEELFERPTSNQSSEYAVWQLLGDDAIDGKVELMLSSFDAVFFLKPKWFQKLLPLILEALIEGRERYLEVPLISTTLNLAIKSNRRLQGMTKREFSLCFAIIVNIKKYNILGIESKIMFDGMLDELKAICFARSQ